MNMENSSLKTQSQFYNKLKESPTYIRSVWKVIGPFVKGRVLDIGGNDGSLLDKYSGKEKYILDIASKALAKARKKGYKVKTGDMHKTGFKSKFFDTVLLIHTFEHSSNPFEFLKEVRRITKKGANVVIEVPNARSLRQFWNLVKGNPLPCGNSPLFLATPNHYFQYTPNILYKTLKRAGFRNIRIFGKPPVKRPFNWMFKILPMKKLVSTDIIAVANP